MSKLTFWLNGQEITIDDPSTQTMLIDYLRSPGVGLSGPKKPCGQGGCGGCTVILSDWDAEAGEPRHRAINSCLHPLVALNGLVVTTVEGTGSTKPAPPQYLSHVPVFHRSAMPAGAELPPALAEAQEAAADKHEHRQEIALTARKALARAGHPAGSTAEDSPGLGMNPVAYRLALNNGSQCGYCSVGFVMNMSDFLVNNPGATQREIEAAMDGNLCRCTGYRPILTGMKTFASDWTEKDEEERMKCLLDPDSQVQLPSDVVAIPFPRAAQAPPRPLSLNGRRRRWLAPQSLAEVVEILRQYDPAATFLTLANTSYGIYPAEYERARTLVDLRFVAELGGPATEQGDTLRIPAGTSYTDLIAVLARANRKPPRRGQDPETTRLGAVEFMARRTAGRIVRNVGTLGGNTMLVLKHIASRTGAPFPSDALTALAAVGARVEYLDAAAPEPAVSTVAELAGRVAADPALAHRLVIVAYHLPRGGAGDVVLAQKVALREVNSHSLVNATTLLCLADDLTVNQAALVFGGIAPYPWHADEAARTMEGRPLSLDDFPELAARLAGGATAQLERWRARRAELPYDGLSPEYQVRLAVSMLYKAMVNALDARGAPVPPAVRSAGEITWGRWPVTRGRQSFEPRAYTAPVSQPYIKLTAMDQASGKIHYTQETHGSPRTVEGAFVQSRRALATYTLGVPGAPAPGGDPAAALDALRAHLAERFPGFVALVTSASVPASGVNLQGMAFDQPVFAQGRVEYVGQSIALAVARTQAQAAAVATYVEARCVRYAPVQVQPGQPGWWGRPVLSLEQAIRVGSIYPDWPTSASFVAHIWKITRPGSRLDWVADRKPLDRASRVRAGTVDGSPCRIVESTQRVGGQKHFYMETQAAVVTPADSGRYDAVLSTQSPLEMHQSIAMALGAQYADVTVRVPSVGGAFGGKTGISAFIAAATALAARQTRLPVRVALSREQDSAMFGKRHPYYGQYQIAIDSGRADPSRKGIIRGLVNRMWGDGGAFYDCSFIVSDCIMTRSDNAYRIANWQAQIDVCRTNTAPSTAFRAFGDVQSKVMFESAIDHAAFTVGMRPEAVREKNLYQAGDVTPFGQSMPYCYIGAVWSYLKEVCGYGERLREVEEFNGGNRWRKRGLAMIPVKYASGYNLAMLEQSAAVAAIYQSDGSVVIHQGGVEMGQGLLTQAQQVAAYVLNLPLDLVDVRDPTTAVIPNPSSTGASTGTTYSAEATKRVCEKLRQRLTEFGYQLLKENGDEWCHQQGVDFWNYGVQGWNATVQASPGANGKLVWQNLVSQAYQKRVSLVCAIGEALPGGEMSVSGLTFKPVSEQPVIPGYQTGGGTGEEVDQFMGFTYSAACSVVEVDILTGETKVLRSDLAYDIGASLNPALDVGQVEGAFVQGIGYLTSEELVVEPTGPNAGRLNTPNTWEYKIPATTSIPLEFNVHLFPRSKAGVPPSPFDQPFSSKEVGEPPLVLATTVFFAIKDAIRASRVERGLSGFFRLDAPATVQEVSRACEVRDSDWA